MSRRTDNGGKGASGPVSRDTAQAIYDTAVDLFHEQGYRATTLRQIADAVGVQVGSLYNYIPSKEGLLFDIMRSVMTELVAGTAEHLENVEEPLEAVSEFLRYGVRFHGERPKEAFIGNTELRSLTGARRRAIVSLRDRYEQMLRDVLDRAIRAGVISVRDAQLASYAAFAICAHVATWYRPDGRLTLDQVADYLTEFYLAAGGAPAEPTRGAGRSGDAGAGVPRG